MTQPRIPTWSAVEAFVDKLDADGCRRLRALLHLRWQEAEHAERRALVASQPFPRSTSPRGRPRRADIERSAVIAALVKHEGAIRAAARELKIPRSTLARHVTAMAIRDWVWAYAPAVTRELHARLLWGSGVSPAVARMRGYETGDYGLLVPLWTVHGRRAWSQTRLDSPRDRQCRYANAGDACPIVDVSPAARARVLDPAEPLLVTESPRKADSAVSAGLACVAFPGIRMLCLDDETWDYIGVRDRDVRIAFDGDAATNPDVGAAEWWLSEYLTSRGACVTVLRLPNKSGLDDFLGNGGQLAALPVVELPASLPQVSWSPRR